MKSIAQYKNFKLVKNTMSEEDEELVPNGMQHIFLPHYESASTSRCVKFVIDEQIIAPKYYRNILNAIDGLGEGDAVLIKIDSGGGRLDSTTQIINAIQQTQAHVHVQIEGLAASAASLIALAAPSVSVSPYASMMIHAASFSSFGGQSNVVSHAVFTDNQVKVLMKDIYQDFLTEKEFDDVLKGQEIWMDADEIVERLEKRAELQEKRYKQELRKAQQKAKSPKSTSKPVLPNDEDFMMD